MLRLFLELTSLRLLLFHRFGQVGDNTSDNNLHADNNVLHKDAEQDDVGAVPVRRVPLTEVLHHD